MLFAIHLNAMNGGEIILDALDAIIARVEMDVHKAEIRDADLLEETNWYKSSRLGRRKLLEEIAQASLHSTPRTRGPHLKKVEVSDGASADVAQKLANTPLKILLENDISDKALVEAALRVIAQPMTAKLCSDKDPGLAVEMESRGGHGQLIPLISRLCEEASKQGRPARLVVVADSDSEWPNHVTKHAHAIRDACSARNVLCVVLSKRTVENYIPDEVWKVLMNANEFAAITRLSAKQRDYIHLDNIDVDPWKQAEPEVQTLFQGVAPADFDTLRRANLKGKKERRTILSLNDERGMHLVTKAAIEARDHNGDLLELVRRIEDEL